MSGKSAIFITGSGKCGTSVVAHSFYSAGFPMGSKADLLVAEGSKGNVRGYWEHAGVLALNRKILAQSGIDWHTATRTVNLRLDDALRHEMHLFIEGFPDGLCCKDPRFVWTADLWSDYFSDLSLIGVFRNPAGFLQSVANVWPDRYGIGAEDLQAFHKWEDTNRRLLDLSRRFPVHWVCFDDPLPLLKGRLRQIQERLGRRFDATTFDAFFISEERRFSSEDDIYYSLHSVPRNIAELYQELRSATDADHRSSRSAISWQKLPNCSLSPDALYLNLLKRCLTRTLFPDGSIIPGFTPAPGDFVVDKRVDGRDWPTEAETMIGLKRLDNIEQCVREVLMHEIPGDLVEAGVWRGGAAIFMRAILATLGEVERRVWLADSFQGLPQPDSANFPSDAGDRHWELTPYLGIPLDVVRANFERYGLLDGQVDFLPGWFKDTLPGAPIEKIAVLRVDGDMYESTIEVLTYLYPKVSAGGYVIIDDYGVLPNCKAAVDDYRLEHGIDSPIQWADWTGIYWQKL